MNNRFWSIANNPQRKPEFVRIWNLRTGALVRRLPEPDVYPLQFSLDGRWLYVLIREGIERIDVRTGEPRGVYHGGDDTLDAAWGREVGDYPNDTYSNMTADCRLLALPIPHGIGLFRVPK